MLTVLLTGANGQLGTYIRHLVSEYPDIQLISTSRLEIDLSQLDTIQEKILSLAPDLVINASAYTNVDKAETDRELAMTINGHAVGEIAKACEKLQASLIQISTDYVFDGEKEGEYLPNDPTNPINYYGATKLQGEQLAHQYCSRTVILRTSWVYSERGKNFETTMKKLFKQKETLNVVNDQFGRPTQAKALASYCLQLARLTPLQPEIRHYAGPEIMTWYQFALKLLTEVEQPFTKVIHPVPTTHYPTPAKRPRNSTLALGEPL